MNRLDHRDPLVFDTHELGRRPGSMRTAERTFQAPEGLGIVDVIGVPVGSEIALDLRLESVVEGVLVTGTAEAHIEGECARCLEPVEDDLDVAFQELYYYPETDERGRVKSSPEDGFSDEEEEETYRLEGDYFDLEPVLRDAVVLALPLQPLCREDCLGLCSECGALLNDDPDHHHEAVDPRWAALQGLTAQGDETRGGAADGRRTENSDTREGLAENQEK